MELREFTFDTVLLSVSIKNYYEVDKAVKAEAPSYEEVQGIVLDHPGFASAAEAHGFLAGLLCLDADADCQDWLDDRFATAENGLSVTERGILEQVWETTRTQLDDFDFSFDLLLPDDEADLTERAGALGEWCQGFLTGIGYSSRKSGWLGTSAEMLGDLADIAELDADASGEADEEAYSELSEFVRVAVQLVRSEILSQTPPHVH